MIKRAKVVVGVCGAKRVGKDTFSKATIRMNHDFEVMHFADPLKEICSTVFGIDIKYFHDEALKELPLEKHIEMDGYLQLACDVTGIKLLPRNLIPKTNRQLLQFFGTEYVRSVQDNYWISKIDQQIEASDKSVLISDLRFLNEAECIRKYQKNLIIRLVRDDIHVDPSHPSESESVLIEEDFIVKSKKDQLFPVMQAAEFVATNRLY